MYNNYIIASSEYNDAMNELDAAQNDVSAKKSALSSNISSAIDSVETDDTLNAYLMNLGDNGAEKLRNFLL